ncbi:carboxylesterase family protein [Polynucleobacter necessarius]|uniref:carboxylesterase family protein n=1 Tax=Polynucleobacter necessarius TaxID=576610 RepID=UPI000E08DC53
MALVGWTHALLMMLQWLVGRKSNNLILKFTEYMMIFGLRKLRTKKVIALILSYIAINAFAVERPTAKVDTGSLQGTVEYNMNVFKGIPYAAPPVGNLRWRPPQQALPWSGVRDASKFGESCPQQFIKNISTGLGLPGSEDCLKLNVYAPTKPGKNLPVMVWIHGGGLVVDGTRDPQFTPINLIKNGVIVVTVEYRLGSLGFFATKELK